MKHYQSEQRKGIERGLGKSTEWIEQDLAVKADTPLIDSGKGKKVVIRMFDFDWQKGMKKEDKVKAKSDKQALFNSVANYIKSFLWKDGLLANEYQDPRIIFTSKGFRIAVVCEARMGNLFIDNPKMLQDIIKPKK